MGLVEKIVVSCTFKKDLHLENAPQVEFHIVCHGIWETKNGYEAPVGNKGIEAKYSIIQ